MFRKAIVTVTRYRAEILCGVTVMRHLDEMPRGRVGMGWDRADRVYDCVAAWRRPGGQGVSTGGPDQPFVWSTVLSNLWSKFWSSLWLGVFPPCWGGCGGVHGRRLTPYSM